MIKLALTDFVTGKRDIADIYAFLQGHFRYELYYTNYSWLIRPHIKEQIDIRIASMDRKCFEDGQCKICGCLTTALQMCDKECDKPCYPEMLPKVKWEVFKELGTRYFRNSGIWNIVDGKFKRTQE